MNTSDISHEFDGNICKLKIAIPKKVKYIRNCDVYVDDYNFIFTADTATRRFLCTRRFDIKDMKNIPIAYASNVREFTCHLPCYPEELVGQSIEKEKGEPDRKNLGGDEAPPVNLLGLSRITDSCVLSIDGEPSEITANYGYGFYGQYKGKPSYVEENLSHISRITNPSVVSPVQRMIQREKDEAKDFCPDQYKLNFVELQIPEGHENPLKYTMPFEDTTLTKDEKCTLHNITSKDFAIKLDADQITIDSGLVSILLAICYDIRTTLNDISCESGWTRMILSSVLSYFDRPENLSAVVDSFLRRSLIYPLYRNYDLSRLCVQDAIEALSQGRFWIVKQLLVTFNCFSQGDYNRKPLNKYFIRDYIRYTTKVIDDDHLQMLSRNLKNVLLNTSKKQLRLGLGEIESELLKELIEDIHLTNSSDTDDDALSGSESRSSANGDAESEGETDDSDDANDKTERNVA